MNDTSSTERQNSASTPRNTYILIDFENVQPTHLGRLNDPSVLVKIFLGPSQSKIPVSLAVSLQPLGTNVEYIVLTSSGKNALDFLIAFYSGKLLTADPHAELFIVSKDTGFDPLVRHLKQAEFNAKRISTLDVPIAEEKTPAQLESKSDAVITQLIRMKASKPRTTKTLLSTIQSLFNKALSEEEASDLLKQLCAKGKAKIDGTKVSYSL